jgi:hypothetical protein
MFAAVNETARSITPISNLIANGILNSITFTLRVIEASRTVHHEKAIRELAHSLKAEYPFESTDYVETLARSIYKDASNA